MEIIPEGLTAGVADPPPIRPDDAIDIRRLGSFVGGLHPISGQRLLINLHAQSQPLRHASKPRLYLEAFLLRDIYKDPLHTGDPGLHPSVLLSPQLLLSWIRTASGDFMQVKVNWPCP